MFKIRFIPLKIAVRPHIDVYQLHRDYSEIPDQYPSVRCNQEDRSQIFKQTYPDSGLSAKIEYEIDVIWEITVA
jgi:hypothetical protein